MSKKTIYTLMSMAFLISIAGCATTNKQSELEIQGLKNQIAALQGQIQEKDAEIDSLKTNVSSGSESSYGLAGNKISKSKAIRHPTIKQIQTSLKNAGYYNGTVDGQMGKQTRVAIKSFQKDNKLTSDGRVGKQTWKILRKYLDETAK